MTASTVRMSHAEHDERFSLGAMLVILLLLLFHARGRPAEAAWHAVPVVMDSGRVLLNSGFFFPTSSFFINSKNISRDGAWMDECIMAAFCDVLYSPSSIHPRAASIQSWRLSSYFWGRCWKCGRVYMCASDGMVLVEFIQEALGGDTLWRLPVVVLLATDCMRCSLKM